MVNDQAFIMAPTHFHRQRQTAVGEPVNQSDDFYPLASGL
jgi:hypothetical protein